MKTMMQLKTALLLLFVSISISSFAVSDSLCSCLQYYYLDQKDSVNNSILEDSINEKLFLRHSVIDLMTDSSLYVSVFNEEIETLQRECTKTGYAFGYIPN